MQTLILIGDSIRLGYESHVRHALSQELEVWSPKENGGTSRNVLAHLDQWVISRAPDIVHLNCGLHDLRTEFGANSPQVPLDEYDRNVRTIMDRVLEETEAKLIWATTTPVNERWHHARKGFDRFEADVIAYNDRAWNAATRFGVPIDDLYGVVMRAGRDEYLQEDGVHFTAAGYALLGQAVVEAVRLFL